MPKTKPRWHKNHKSWVRIVVFFTVLLFLPSQIVLAEEFDDGGNSDADYYSSSYETSANFTSEPVTYNPDNYSAPADNYSAPLDSTPAVNTNVGIGDLRMPEGNFSAPDYADNSYAPATTYDTPSYTSSTDYSSNYDDFNHYEPELSDLAFSENNYSTAITPAPSAVGSIAAVPDSLLPEPAVFDAANSIPEMGKIGRAFLEVVSPALGKVVDAVGLANEVADASYGAVEHTEMRRELATYTLGLIPVSNEQAAHLQAQGEELTWFERPYFSSEDGLSVLNEGANYGDTLTGILTNDILHPWADKARVAELNQGLVGLTSEQRRDYIRSHAEEYKQAGAESIFAGGGFGEMVVDPKDFQGKDAFKETSVYYRGNLTDKERDPTYAGKMDNVLLTLPLYPENYTEVKNIKDLTKPYFGENIGGTAGLIAKAGNREIYLTAEHCVPDTKNIKEGTPLTFGVAVPSFSMPQFKVSSYEELLKRIAEVQKYNNAQEKIGERQIKEHERVTIEKIYKDPAVDVAVFAVDRANQEPKAGESIQITPIDNTDLQKGEELKFYGVPIWKQDIYNSKWELLGDRVYSGKVVQDRLLVYPHLYELGGTPVIAGWSGSPIFKKGSNGLVMVEGLISRANDPSNGLITTFIGDWVDPQNVKPSAIRQSIEGFRAPSLNSEELSNRFARELPELIELDPTETEESARPPEKSEETFLRIATLENIGDFIKEGFIPEEPAKEEKSTKGMGDLRVLEERSNNY